MRNRNSGPKSTLFIASVIMLMGAFGGALTVAEGAGKASAGVGAAAPKQTSGGSPYPCNADEGNCIGADWYPVAEIATTCCCPTTSPVAIYVCIGEREMYKNDLDPSLVCFRRLYDIYTTDLCIKGTTGNELPGSGGGAGGCCSK